MGLNKQNGNMYEFVTHTWNPIAGKCKHECIYCSTNKFIYPALIKKYQGEQRIDEKELKTNLGKGNFIFVAAQNDLFTMNYVDINCVLDHCRKFDNEYLFQTKNPSGFNGFTFPDKSKFCITIETNRWYPLAMGNCQSPKQRLQAVEFFKLRIDMLTIEPIMDFDLESFVEMIALINPSQVNIGSDTGRNNLVEPSKEKILSLIAKLETFTKVVQKSNLKRLLK